MCLAHVAHCGPRNAQGVKINAKKEILEARIVPLFSGLVCEVLCHVVSEN